MPFEHSGFLEIKPARSFKYPFSVPLVDDDMILIDG